MPIIRPPSSLSLTVKVISGGVIAASLNNDSMKSFIFDLDGTLVDSRHDIAESVNLTLDALSIPRLPLEHVIACVGHGVRTLLTKVLSSLDTERDVNEAEALFRKIYKAHLN